MLPLATFVFHIIAWVCVLAASVPIQLSNTLEKAEDGLGLLSPQWGARKELLTSAFILAEI